MLLTAIQHDMGGIQEPTNVTNILLDTSKGITQFDMTTALYAFSTLLVMFPRELGVDPNDIKGIQGFIHLWAVIGSMMGVHDKYNTALHANDTLSRERILKDITLASIKYMNKQCITIPSTIASVGNFLPIRVNALIYFFIHGVFKLESPKLLNTLSLFEKSLVRFMSTSMRIMSRSSLIRITVNRFVAMASGVVFKLYSSLHGGIPEFT
jgi:hypothetical protein